MEIDGEMDGPTKTHGSASSASISAVGMCRSRIVLVLELFDALLIVTSSSSYRPLGRRAMIAFHATLDRSCHGSLDCP